MLPREIPRETQLIHDGQIDAAIIYPKIDPAYRALAVKLGEELNRLASNQVPLLADRDLMPEIRNPLPADLRSNPLIILGNLNTNRALLPLYASYLCFDDALYPGGKGYDLRTLVNPYGKGRNVILVGGSNLAGVETAVDRLISHIRAVGRTGEVKVPYLMEIELEPGLKEKLYAWPDAPLNVPLPKGHHELFTLAGSYGIMYALTGDRRFGELGAACINGVNAQMNDSYGDRHYFTERVVRVLPWLEAGGFLSDAEILRTDQLLMGMALASQDAWWRMKSGKPPLGHRHHGKGTHEFYLVARYLREQASPEPELAVLCERWMRECTAFLDTLGRAGLDDQDDQSSLNNMSTIFWFSLSEERFEFFESGAARAWAQRAIALHDNMGTAAGPGGYDESLLGMPFIHHEAATPVASCAFYYQDGRFKWILENLPHLDLPLRGGFWAFCPIFLHKFDTGPELQSMEPEGLTGLQVLPATRYQVELNNNPPVHYEYSGHMVNAPENWLPAEGIGKNTLPQEKAFDKVVLRKGFKWEDPYLILQGYQGGFRWQGHMNAANCIIRFSQAGHIFLMQNTREHSQFYKNGVLVSDGFNDSPTPPIAEWLALDEFDQAGMSITRLNDYHRTGWTRHLFWFKQPQDFFVVIDRIIPKISGEYSAVCTWRSLAFARLEGRSWTVEQGDHRFTLRSSENLVVTCVEEYDLGAANPYVLHQFKGGYLQEGDPIEFQNIFFVQPSQDHVQIDIRRVGSGQALIFRDGKRFAWVGTANDGQILHCPGLEVEARSAWATAEAVLLAGALRMEICGEHGFKLASDGPVGIDLDLTNRILTVHIDGPACKNAVLKIIMEGEEQAFKLSQKDPVSLNLSGQLCDYWADEISHQLDATRLVELSPVQEATPSGDIWHKSWEFGLKTRIPERVREMRIYADPPPMDGIADQLIDTVTLEVREIWQLWPDAQQYKITLDFPPEKPIDYLDLIGDSKDDPIFKVFSPLPKAIHARALGIEGKKDFHPCQVESVPGQAEFKRFKGEIDRMETRRVKVGRQVSQVEIIIPSPENDRPLVLQEIAAYSTHRTPPKISHILCADLEGDGQNEIITTNTANEIVVIKQEGSECWSYPCSTRITSISCHDLENDGRKYVCAGLLDGDLLILEPSGKLYIQIKIRQKILGRNDVFAGLLPSINSINIWQRDARGKAGLVVGGYAMLVFLDSDGEVIGHSWFDGAWIFNILVVPQGEQGEGDLWARCGWNHGIGRYEGKPGFEPSGEWLAFGGVRQPMFRPLRRLIPFVNGRSAAFDWFTQNELQGRVIVAAAEDGMGVLSTRTQNFLWKIEGGTSITSCTAIHGQDRDEVIIGGVDGFAAAFDLVDGHPLRKWRTGAPVIGFAPLEADHLLAVVTTQGVWALDEDWHILAFYPIEATHMSQMGKANVIVACKNGSIVELSSKH